MSFFIKLINLILNKKYEPVIITEVAIPFHIKEIAKLYPLLHTVAGNKAVGEIRLFQFDTGHENKLRVGQAFVMKKKGDHSVWVHLGFNYFKLVMKA